VHRTLLTPRRAVELLAAAVAGGVIVLGGAAALGKLDATHTVVRESAAAYAAEPASFGETTRRSIHDVYAADAPGVVGSDLDVGDASTAHQEAAPLLVGQPEQPVALAVDRVVHQPLDLVRRLVAGHHELALALRDADLDLHR
jgi:hypothetical protein